MIKVTDKIDYIPVTVIPDEHKKVRFKRSAQYIIFSVEDTLAMITMESVYKHRRLSNRRIALIGVFPQSESLAELILQIGNK